GGQEALRLCDARREGPRRFRTTQRRGRLLRERARQVVEVTIRFVQIGGRKIQARPWRQGGRRRRRQRRGGGAGRGRRRGRGAGRLDRPRGGRRAAGWRCHGRGRRDGGRRGGNEGAGRWRARERRGRRGDRAAVAAARECRIGHGPV